MSFIDVINNLVKKELARSLAKTCAANNAIKESPKTEMPGANDEIVNKSTGTLLLIADISNSKISGKARPKNIEIGSLIISFVTRLAKMNVFMSLPPS